MNGAVIAAFQQAGIAGSDWVIQRTGDLDGDGTADILWRQNGTGVVGFWKMNGGTLVGFQQIGPVSADWVVHDLADLNGDRRDDIVWRQQGTGLVSAWLMSGNAVVGTGGGWGVGTDWNIRPVGLGAITLAWNDNSGNESGFIVERAPQGMTTYVEVARTPPNVTSYTDRGLPGLNRYSYRVRAFNAATITPPSNEASGAPK
jgi:hypothetical protein